MTTRKIVPTFEPETGQKNGAGDCSSTAHQKSPVNIGDFAPVSPPLSPFLADSVSADAQAAYTEAERRLAPARNENGTFAEGNTAAVTHGLYARQHQAALVARAEALGYLPEHISAIEADLGGADQLSRLQRDLVREYAHVALFTSDLCENLVAHGTLTTKGRKRAALGAYLLLVDRKEKLARLLGLARKPKDLGDEWRVPPEPGS